MGKQEKNLKKKDKRRDKKKATVSMKEALGSLAVLPVEKKKKSNFNLRDWFWNYPGSFSKLFKKLIPFSYIFLFGILGVSFFFLVMSGSVANIFQESSNKSSYVEGFVGSSSTFNPLFISVNEVDRCVQNLVFEKLIDLDEQGNPVPNIAKSWSVSDDDLEYVFEIQNGLYWQDEEPLTVDDVVFTFNTAISLYSELGYDSVGSSLVGMVVERVDDTHVSFTLDESSATFFEAVSIYIVPEHRLEDVELVDMPFDIFAKYPVGSGRYSIQKNEDTYISLVDSDTDVVDPTIDNVTFRLYGDTSSMEAAFRNGVLDSLGVLDMGEVDFVDEYSNYTMYTKTLELRNKEVFLNNRNGIFEDVNMRLGISYLVDIEKLLDLSGIDGAKVLGPIQSSSWAFNDELEGYSYDYDQASEYLKNAGYTMHEDGYFESEDGEILSFTISYFNSDVNNKLVDALEELLLDEGVVLKKEPLSYAQISQEIIATRSFEMLLYEIETMIDPDQYNLWHSLKVNYPDLNISGYEYERVDILLEEARSTSDKEVRKEKYLLFQRYLMEDAPVIFLYHPVYTYVVDQDLVGVDISSINYPYQRFDNIQDWYWD